LTAQKPARRLRKALDALAYASLVFDICIAVVTSVRARGIGDFQSLLIPVNYALTAVVVLSAVVLIILLIERAFRRDSAPTAAPTP
jgi:lysozyme family protein